PKKKYSMPEIIDIVNDALLANSATQKFYMINRERSFTLVPADEKIDETLLPRIGVEELETRGRTELVSLQLPLKTLVAEDVAPEVTKMMGPFGSCVAMKTGNQLILRDTVGTLRRIKQTIDSIEKGDSVKAGSLSHKCEWIKASEAERILKSLLGDPKELLAAAGRAGAAAPWGGGDGGGGAGGGFGRGPAPVIQINRLRMHFITSNERTNTVLVTGPADKVAEAEKILKEIDVKTPGQLPIAIGPPSLK